MRSTYADPQESDNIELTRNRAETHARIYEGLRAQNVEMAIVCDHRKNKNYQTEQAVVSDRSHVKI